MPLASPTLITLRLSSRAFRATVTTQLNQIVDIYIRNTSVNSMDYTFYGSRTGSGVIDVINLVENSYYLVYVVARNNADSLSLPTFSSVDLGSSETIQGAIKKRWYTSPELVSFFKGGLFLNEVPESIEGRELILPYVMFRNDQTEFYYTLGASYIETGEFSFTVFAAGAASAEACLDLIQNTFDFKNLSFSNADSSTISIIPNNRSMTSENFRYKDGNLIFRGSLNYDILINRLQ